MKTDFKKQLPAYSASRGVFEIVTVPRLRYLMVDGHGDPNTSTAYQDALAALYPLAYAVKFLSKNELGRDYVVMPLEGLWWSDDMDSFTVARDKSRWEWTMMIMTPDWLSSDHVEVARGMVREKGRARAIDSIRLAPLDEGQVVQTLHVGSYDDETPVLRAMHSEFIPSHQLRMVGKHHEIYLSDARRTAPANLKTILRQPVAETVERSGP